ncbi:efflux RND transporter periplasmic adaptor subunit [Roseiconus lacunae]|uniref:efflux RND transporter periplasmic adaptor subunit n=1 Tax=Roseiconus lacunae TaxID=2605694 RepID=UPI0011F35178|nr:efflux RND transporter periplasmic adaptor subunit [Roseiconus lacunae]
MRATESTDHGLFGTDESTSVLTWRSDLRSTVSKDDAGAFVVVEDPIANKYFRIGQTEYCFVRLLDSRRSLSEVYAEFLRLYPDNHLSFDDALSLGRWLISNDLAQTTSSNTAARLNQSKTSWQRKQTLDKSNPLSIRIDLFPLDRLSKKLNRWIGFIFSPPATALLAIWMLVVFALGIWSWDTIKRSAQLELTGSTISLLGLITVVLKILHELGHGIVCRRYGGRVGSLGILLILFAPLPFVDVSSVWRFRSRWQRVHVALAGMFVELLIASIAIAIWFINDDVTVRYVCSCVVVSAGLMTLLFNANPLMRFDGYYALTDALGWTDLYGDGQRLVSEFMQRLFYGEQFPTRHQSVLKTAFIAFYGAASMIWKYVICAMILTAAASLFHGVGFLLTLTGILLWIGIPLVRSIEGFGRRVARQQTRCLIVSGCFVALAIVIGFFGYWPIQVKAPAIVQYAAQDTIRSQVDGFVDQIHVRDGDPVSRGDRLLTLRNPSLLLEAQRRQIELDKAELQTRKLLLQGQHAASQAEATRCEVLRKQKSELDQQIASLELRSPHDGIVVARRIEELEGTYIEQGVDLLVVSQNGEKELRVLVPQREIETLQTNLGGLLHYRVVGHSVASGTLSRINPRASDRCLYPAMLATNNGPLAVLPDEDLGMTEHRHRLITPHFEAIVTLTPQASHQLRCGHRALVSIGVNSVPLAKRLWHQGMGW